MQILIVVDNLREWPFEISGVEVIDARSYLTKPEFGEVRGVKLFNLCRSYRYQSLGYYVTLLATARGHKPLPNIMSLQDLKSQTVVRYVSDDLDELIQRCLAPIESEKFTLSVYFGRNLARRYDRLSLQLFNLFQAPLLRAQFVNNGKWQLRTIDAIPVDEIPEQHKPFVVEVASEHFAGRRVSVPKRERAKYDLAILVNAEEPLPPSNDKALQRFVKAAESHGLHAEMIGRDDYARLAEFDALFIRETTAVGHHTYRFARRAAIEGLVVMDDPESILKCSNKVYLAELMGRHKVPVPRTLVVHKDNIPLVGSELGLPCVLKQPDAAFSQGVVKVESEDALANFAELFLTKSDLLIAQEFLPTTYDWRIGVFDKQPLYACRYHMVQKHWQITQKDERGGRRYGRTETLPVQQVPRQVVKMALKAANLIGNGLYGVDVKQIGRQCYVIEVNDNPNIDAGVEDDFLKEELYDRIMEVFLERIEQSKAGAKSP
ncbi:MAG TPA: RimK family protein [Pirellulales bacterium]|jgi:glutathione synthase/RimK-type ligase-like ATP-grasp enzyme|nr:RimK family protein [Pirellulales bacterium]